jgi:hypothetical protein
VGVGLEESAKRTNRSKKEKEEVGNLLLRDLLLRRSGLEVKRLLWRKLVGNRFPSLYIQIPFACLFSFSLDTPIQLSRYHSIVIALSFFFLPARHFP